MKLFNLNSILALILSCSGAFAIDSPKQINKEQADLLAIEYERASYTKATHTAKLFELAIPECPTQDQTSCLKVICDNTKDCGFDSNVKEIAQACRGVNGECVEVLCAKTKDCIFKSSAIALAESCRSSNGLCARVGCEKTGDCVFSSNAKQIAQACAGVDDGNCVKFACDRSNSCNFKSNFIAIARSCAGY